LIVQLVASLGNNVKLAKQLEDIVLAKNAKIKTVNLCDLNLPLYDTRVEEKEGIPPQAKELSETLKQAKGFIVVAPEYNGSTPPVFNNALAWLSRSGDEDWRAGFNDKYCVVATHSGGGGQKVLQAMKGQMEHLGCNSLARVILTHYKKELNPESAEHILSSLIKLCQ
jgi:chromate reductase, NAD(P)H dehydrogenase (quinone)